MSEPHPNSVGSYAASWLPWIEDPKGGDIPLRPWQRTVLERALEHDADGNLCWRFVIVSTPRQMGKGWLIRAWAAARCHFASQFGQVQEVLHLSNNLRSAKNIHAQSWKWAADSGLSVRQAMGNERIIWPDGSSWAVSNPKSIYGSSGSLIFLDECWDVDLDILENAIVPTAMARVQPQILLTSTSNPDATLLLPSYRRQAIEGSSRVMIAEWSVPPDADADDPAVWEHFLPYWDDQRLEFMEAARGNPAFRTQYLNQWPDHTTDAGVHEWPEGWSGCPEAAADAPAGGVAAMESTVNREFYGTAYAVKSDDGVVSIWTARHTSLESAQEWVEARRPSRCLVGLSLTKYVALTMPVEGYGASQTILATPAMENLVRRGLLVHDHGAEAAEQTGHAQVVQSERGIYISGKQSKGAIDTIKCAAWAAFAAELPALEAPAIW